MAERCIVAKQITSDIRTKYGDIIAVCCREEIPVGDFLFQYARKFWRRADNERMFYDKIASGCPDNCGERYCRS